MANGTTQHNEKLRTSIHNLLHPKQQVYHLMPFYLNNPYPGNGVSQEIDLEKLDKIEAKKFIRQWRKAAKRGDARAQYNLGIAYANGKGVAKDDKKAVDWWRKAAKQGNVEAQNNLGVAYANPIGIAKDYEKALDWWHKAAEQGNTEAQNNLGVAYVNGEGVAKDYEKAAYFWRKAAKQGNIKAQNNLGVMYSTGKNILKNYKQAIYWWEKAAIQGDAEAQNYLGLAYINDENVAKDYKQAIYWWEKGAEQAYVNAQYHLGVAYYKGQGIPQNYEQAIYWWEKAAKQGFAQAQYNLGVVYANAKGVTKVAKDYEKAVYWWDKAAKQGHISAQFYLAKICDKQKNEEVQNKTSFEWLCQVAASLVSLNEKIDDDTTIFEPIFDKDDVDYLNQQDNAVTQVILALLYKTGNAVQKDEQQAFSLFQKAAQQQDILAQYCLGLAYMEGQGIAVNIEKAREQFQQIIDRLKEKQVFSYIPFSLERNDTEDSQDYPLDVRQWIALLARDKLSLLDERAARQQLAAAKQDLEDIMAMFAHKFRGPLQKIEYHVEKGHPAKRSLDAIHTMRGLLDIFSVISTNPAQLRDMLKQDRQGKGTLLWVLEKSLILAIYQLLSINQVDKIRQHYFAYAKRMGQIPSTITRLVWDDEYFELEEQLQSEWEDNFTPLLNDSHLDDIVAWMDKRFFPIHIQGFTDNPIRFAYQGTTASALTIVMTEMILNAIKYYASENCIPLQLKWYCEKDVCHFVSQNPTAIEEQSGKGSGRGHKFLGLIAKQLGGDFPKPRFQDDYVTEFCMPTHLLIEES